MEELFEQLKRVITPAHDSAAKRTATAMDGISDRMADAAAASYIASVAEDAGFEESDHPREAKGGKGGGRFRTSGKTIEKEDIKEKKPFNIPNILESLADDLENGSPWADVAKTLYESGWIPDVSTDKAKSVMERVLSGRRGKGEGDDWGLPAGTSPQMQPARGMPFMSDKTKKALKDNGFFIEKDMLNRHLFNLRHKDGFILDCSWTPTDSAKDNDEGFAREMREVARVEKVEHVLPEKTRKALNALVDSLSKGA